MDVGFYLDNEYIDNVDLSNPEKGNPGVGGTQFLTVSLPYYLNKQTGSEFSSVLYANVDKNMPDSITVREADSPLMALKRANDENLNFFIWRPTENESGKEFISNVDKYSVKLVCWMHNTTSAGFLHQINNKCQTSGFVFVGREQLDLLRDCNIFDNSTYIFNGFDATYYIPNSVKCENKIVTYMGSLIPAKGFHILAKQWPHIKRKVPDAQLRVIGTGQLYDRNEQLGQWGLAKESYEMQFRPHLSDDNGNPMDSVIFEGLVDTDRKIELLQNSTVGVANPSGNTANCPGSAIEFQAAGTPVVSVAHRGMFDVIKHGQTGLLGKNEKEIGKQIIDLLSNQQQAKKMGNKGIRFVEERFDYERVCKQWLDVLHLLAAERSLPEYELVNKYHNYKFAREYLRIIKNSVPMGNHFPCLMKMRETISTIRST